MSPKPALRKAIALVFVAVLILQGFAVAPPCAAAAAQLHCDHGASSTHASCDGSCCLVALATAVARWSAPAPISARSVTVAPIVPPSLAPDRLDRPPRPA